MTMKIERGLFFGQGQRPTMEDQMKVIDFKDGICVLLCDGHGENGKKAADLVLKGIAGRAVRFMSCDPEGFGLVAGPAFAELDKAVDESFGERTGVAATVIRISDYKMCSANVGDVEVHRISKDPSRTAKITTLHRFSVEVERERAKQSFKRIPEAEVCLGKLCLGDECALMLTRSIGDGRFRSAGVIHEPSICTDESIEPGEVLVVGTDGLWDALLSPGMTFLSLLSMSAAKATVVLSDLCKEKSDDNYAGIVLRVT